MLYSRLLFLFFFSLMVFSEKSYSFSGTYCCCSDTPPFPCRDGDGQHCCSYQETTDPSHDLICSYRKVKESGSMDLDPNPCGKRAKSPELQNQREEEIKKLNPQ
jgi:hypothetical protein